MSNTRPTDTLDISPASDLADVQEVAFYATQAFGQDDTDVAQSVSEYIGDNLPQWKNGIIVSVVNPANGSKKNIKAWGTLEMRVFYNIKNGDWGCESVFRTADGAVAQYVDDPSDKKAMNAFKKAVNTVVENTLTRVVRVAVNNAMSECEMLNHYKGTRTQNARVRALRQKCTGADGKFNASMMMADPSVKALSAPASD